jgi:hypothetical protein
LIFFFGLKNQKEGDGGRFFVPHKSFPLALPCGPGCMGGTPSLAFRSTTCFVILLNPFLRNVCPDSPKKIWNSLLILHVRSRLEEMLSFLKVLFKHPSNVLKSAMISLQDYRNSLCRGNTNGQEPDASTV